MTMLISLPDIYIYFFSEGVMLQGASQAGIDHLSNLHGPIYNGTAVIIQNKDAEEAFAFMDAEGLFTMTF